MKCKLITDRLGNRIYFINDEIIEIDIEIDNNGVKKTSDGKIVNENDINDIINNAWKLKKLLKTTQNLRKEIHKDNEDNKIGISN